MLPLISPVGCTTGQSTSTTTVTAKTSGDDGNDTATSTTLIPTILVLRVGRMPTPG